MSFGEYSYLCAGSWRSRTYCAKSVRFGFGAQASNLLSAFGFAGILPTVAAK
jgi:hypothetical protein